MRKIIFSAVVLLATIAVFAVSSHFKTVGDLEARIKQLEEKVATAQSQSESALAASKSARRNSSAAVNQVGLGNPASDGRLTDVEAEVVKLKQATEYLMERGQLPLDARKAEEMLAKLKDGSLPDSERLSAFRLLRKDHLLNEEGVASVLAWLHGSSKANTRREILRSMENLTNGIMKQPMMDLAVNDPNNTMREQAIENLRVFVSDPVVEQMLWAQLAVETDPRVRQEILNSLSRGPVTTERALALQSRAMNPAASMEERLLAMNTLRRSDTDIQQIVSSFATMAQGTQDPKLKAQIFGAFDGMSDPTLKVPLVYGLQDADARVRERAADALSGYTSDPAVQQWLRYVVENDPDSRVRREAQQALEQQRSRPPFEGRSR